MTKFSSEWMEAFRSSYDCDGDLFAKFCLDWAITVDEARRLLVSMNLVGVERYYEV